MADVGMQPSQSLAERGVGGGSPRLSEDDTGWRPAGGVLPEEEEEEEEEERGETAGVGPDPGTTGEPQRPGQQPGKGRPPADDEWRESGKKKHRRRPSKKKRRWKPYNKLTWEEKKVLEERESLRAARVRAEMFAKGQPVAPYNTTQFLMEDHDQEEPDLCHPPKRAASLPPGPHPNASSSNKGDSSEDDLEEEEGGGAGSDGMGGHGAGEFLQRDFSETYERYHAESLQDMSKQELIREYMELEKCLSRMEDDNNRLRLAAATTKAGPPPDDPRIGELETELERLKAENRRLLRERETSMDTPSDH